MYTTTMTSSGPTDISQVRTQRVNSRTSTQPHDEDTEQKPKRFIRVDSKTKISRLLCLMRYQCKIERPNLVISVIGDEEKFSTTSQLELDKLFRFGLVNAARKTDAWIITGGSNVGVAKHVGEALKYSCDNSKNQKDIVVIGIAPWEVFQNKHLLGDIQHSEPIQCTIEDNLFENETSLDPNHSHYIMVDNGTQPQIEPETAFRAAFELECKRYFDCDCADFASVPVVLLVMDGGPHILKRVRLALSKDIPVVIVKSSGLVANLLSYAFNNAEETELTNKSGIRNRRTKRLTDTQRLWIQDKMKNNEFCETEDVGNNINEIEDCLDRFELVNIFELGGSEHDLYITMCKAVLKANESDLVRQLRIGFSLNWFDFAWSAILTAEEGWEHCSLDDIMMSAILSNKVDSVELLLDKGINMKTFLTARRLMTLYDYKASSNDFFISIATKERLMEHDAANYMMMLGKEFTHYLGDYYLQQYSSDPGKDVQKKEATFENPFLHLLIWAVLNQLKDMAKLFWRKGLDSIAAALLAHALLSDMAMRNKSTNPDLCDDIETSSREFMDLATGVLQECYRTNKNYTYKLLTGDLLQWENVSCILLAMKTNNKSFVSAPECQEVFSDVWMGQMTRNNSILKLLICMFFPPLIPLSVEFKMTQIEFIAGLAPLVSEMMQQEMFGESSGKTDSEGKKQDADVPISDEENQPIIAGTSTQIGQQHEDPEAGASSPNESLLQKSPSQLTEDCSRCWGKDQRENLRSKTLKYFRKAKKIPLFYRSPVVCFLSHTISYMVFLCLYIYVLISKFDQDISVEDVILIVWVVNIFIEEICQVIETKYIYNEIKLKAYLARFWNIADILVFLLFVIGIILKHLPYQGTWEAARIVLGVNLIICFLRLLQMFSLNKELGPKLVMIIFMVRNLTSFFVILLIFIVAYAIASHAILYPNTEISFEVLMVMFRRPYWNIYGELMLDEIEGTNDCTNIVELYQNGIQPRCPTEYGTYFVPVLMGVYMLMCNILLLNLLISIFSNTFKKVQQNANKYWRIQRYHQIQDYISRSMFVPPISFIEVVMKIIVYLKRYMCQRCTSEQRSSQTNVYVQPFSDEDSRDVIRKWERTIAQDFINNKKIDLASIDYSVKAITLRQDQLVSKIDALQHTVTASSEQLRIYRSQIDRMAESESINVVAPGSVNVDQRMDYTEEPIIVYVETQPGAKQASPEITDERVEDLPDTIRRWARTIAQDCINSMKVDLKTMDHNLTLRLDKIDKKLDALEEQQHTDTATIQESNTFDEHGSVNLEQRMDNIEAKLQRLIDAHKPGAEQASPEKTDEIVDVQDIAANAPVS